ncbi:MAG: autotransporter outer membrane beta-barrel domain-containing protein [Armatimonadota bacterium]
MSNKPFAFALATICAMGLTMGLQAATITVSGGGTIASAINSAAAGDTIFVDKATHLEIGDSNIAILAPTKNLTIRGRGKDLTAIQCYFNLIGPQPGAPLPGFEFTTQSVVDGWPAGNSVTKSYVAGPDGGIRWDVTGGDPFCGTPNINLGNAPITCTFRVWSSLGGDFQIFWMGATGGISEANSKHFTATANAWNIFTFNMPALGAAANFRFDGPGASGYYILNYMRFEGQPIAAGVSNMTFQDLTLDGGTLPSGGPRPGVNLLNGSNCAITLTNVRLKQAGANGVSVAGGSLTSTGSNFDSNVTNGVQVSNGTVSLTGGTASLNASNGVLISPAAATSNLSVSLTNTTVAGNVAGMAVNASGTTPAALTVNTTGCTLTCSKDFALLLSKWWGLNASIPGTYNINTTTFGNSNLGIANLAGGAVVNLTGCTISDTGWAILNQGGNMNSVGTMWNGGGIGILNNGGTVTCDATSKFQGGQQLQAGTTVFNGSIFEGGVNLNCVTPGTVVTLNNPEIRDLATNNFISLGDANVTVNGINAQGKAGNLFAIMRSASGVLNINGYSATNKLNLDPLFKNPADNTDRAIVFVRNAGGTLNLKWLTATKIPATNEFVSANNDDTPLVGPSVTTYSKCAFYNGSGGFRATTGGVADATPISMTAGNTIWQGTGFPGSHLNLNSDSTVPSTMTLDNCTIYGGTVANLISGNAARGDVVTANYCIIDATGGLQCSATVPLVGKGNIVQAGTAGDFLLGKPADTVIGDAKLDPATGYLTADSKLAFGMAIDSTRTFDVNDNVRPMPAGTKPDIGAYEFNQAVPFIVGTYLDAALTVAEMAGKSIDVVIKQGANVVTTSTAVLDAAAQFKVGVPAGTYDVLAKSTHWLRVKAADVVVADVDVPVAMAPVNGDADGDNQVNLFDIVVLDQNFGSSDAMADLDCSGSVNLFDYVIIDQNFGAAGAAL